MVVMMACLRTDYGVVKVLICKQNTEISGLMSNSAIAGMVNMEENEKAAS